MKCFNLNYGPGQTIGVGGKTYRSNHHGVFNIPDADATERLIGTPGWHEGEPNDDQQREMRKHVAAVGAAMAANETALLQAQVELEAMKAKLAEAEREKADALRAKAEAEAAAMRAELEALKAAQKSEAPADPPAPAGDTEKAPETSDAPRPRRTRPASE